MTWGSNPEPDPPPSRVPYILAVIALSAAFALGLAAVLPH